MDRNKHQQFLPHRQGRLLFCWFWASWWFWWVFWGRYSGWWNSYLLSSCIAWACSGRCWISLSSCARTPGSSCRKYRLIAISRSCFRASGRTLCSFSRPSQRNFCLLADRARKNAGSSSYRMCRNSFPHCSRLNSSPLSLSLEWHRSISILIKEWRMVLWLRWPIYWNFSWKFWVCAWRTSLLCCSSRPLSEVLGRGRKW